jgi:carboxypeptidase Q
LRGGAARRYVGAVPRAARASLLCAALALASAAAGCRRAPSGVTDADVAAYRDTARRIAEATRDGDGAFRRVAALTDLFGPRPTGSPALAHAIEWARDTFVADGQENVALEAVRVPVWMRGLEAAEIVAPAPRKLALLGLGTSVGTPPEGITAEVLVVSSFDELAQRGAEAKGKIVLFNRPFPTGVSPAAAYGQTLPYRTEAAARAAAYGAVGALVRSLASASLGAPHTGAMHDGPEHRIPAAALSVEDAALVARLAARGPVRLHLTMQDRNLPDGDSFNVLADLRGRERPEEIVVIGAHIDSWDVGQGAQDDGTGCAVVMEALATLRRLGLVPRRTIRAVLYTSEEIEARGGHAYADAHAGELGRHVAAFETDVGAGVPLGFRMNAQPAALADARALVTLLAPIGATSVEPGFGGADIAQMRPAGVPLLGLFSDPTHYFDVHHSAADTLDKIDPVALGRNVAAMATMAFVVADRSTRWH